MSTGAPKSRQGLLLNILLVLVVNVSLGYFFLHRKTPLIDEDSESATLASTGGAGEAAGPSPTPGPGSALQKILQGQESADSSQDANAGTHRRLMTLAELEARFKTKFNMEPENSSNPFRLSGDVAKSNYPELDELGAAALFLSEAAGVLGLDQPQQLMNDRAVVEDKTLGKVAVFQQALNSPEGESVPVEGGIVRVHFGSTTGDIFMVNSTYFPNIPPNLSFSVVVTKETAVIIATRDAQKPINGVVYAITRQSEPTKVIFKFSDGTYAVSWKITIIQTERGAEGVGVYFVNVQTGAFERRVGGVE